MGRPPGRQMWAQARQRPQLSVRAGPTRSSPPPLAAEPSSAAAKGEEGVRPLERECCPINGVHDQAEAGAMVRRAICRT